MPKKGVGWPAVGQTSHELEEHKKFIVEEARQLLEYGAPSDDAGVGKQCPYHTLNAFCTSVVAYLEVPTPKKPASGRKVNYEEPQETPITKQAGTNQFPPQAIGQSLSPSTPQQNHQANQNQRTPLSIDRALPLNIDTYGVLVLYVPSNYDVDNQKRAIKGIISVNKGFIPGISIKSIEWLIPEWTKTKHYSNLLIEFTRPDHANAAIREQLLVGTKVLGCEYYERDSRLRHCYYCQQYGHLEPQCQATRSACGRCAGRHVTADCKVREDAHNFRCAVCGGAHRAWDNVCEVRRKELDRVRNARAKAPKYHIENGRRPKDDEMGDVPSREFAGTSRYAIDFLVEVNLRGGRKSHGRNRGKGGRQSGLPDTYDEDEAVLQPETPYSARMKAGRSGLDSFVTPQSARIPFRNDRFNNEAWFRSRLLEMDIEPYSPGKPRPDQEIEDERTEPPTPTPERRRDGVWDRFAQTDSPSSRLPERARKSLASATKPVERTPSEKAASFAKIRKSDSWR